MDWSLKGSDRFLSGNILFKLVMLEKFIYFFKCDDVKLNGGEIHGRETSFWMEW